MNQITTVPPNVSSAGHSFNYALWTAGTVVTLVNVPWDSDYRSVYKPKNGQSLDGWINDQPNRLVINQLKANRLNQPVRIDTPFELAVGYNYIRATNPAQPVAGSLPSTYYYFIKNVEYGAPNTTILNLQLDVWATFGQHVSFGRCYIERGHIGVANSNQNQQNGRNYLTVPEGMDLGGEMEVARTWQKEIATARGDNDVVATSYSIMVTATTDLEAAEQAGTDSDAKIITAGGSRLENLPNGGGIYFFAKPGDLRAFYAGNKDKSWVTQSITSITAIPDIGLIAVPKTEINLASVPPGGVFVPDAGSIPQLRQTMATNWITDLGTPQLPNRYRNLHKFNTYPYCVIELTTYSGQPILLKPESLPSRALDVSIIFHVNPGSARMTIVPVGYNKAALANDSSDDFGFKFDGGEWLDFATTISNFPQFSTVNNSFAAFMAANKNQIAFQQESAGWDQQRAMMGANTAFDQATSGMNTAQDVANAGIMRTSNSAIQGNTTAAMQGGVSMLQGVAGAGVGAAAGGGMGAAVGGVSNVGGTFANTAIQMNQNTQQASIDNAYARQSSNSQIGNMGNTRDTNMVLAQSVSAGDYANAIAGVQARVQDNKMLQPTTSGQIGGDAFNLATVGWNVVAKLKRLHGVALAEVGEYWLRYGYRVNRWVTPPASLQVCDRFTYWQMKDAVVFSDACPEEYRQTIRGIFEVGVTVYNDPDDIGRIDPADNNPLGGISY